jgi:adenylate cyclase
MAQNGTFNRRRGWLLIPVLFSLLTLMPPVRRAELWTIDQRFLRRDVHRTEDRVVVVALDDKADEAWKAEPIAFWGEHLAGLVDKCVAGGARSVGIDLLLQVDTDRYLEDRFGVTSHLPNLALENALAAADGKFVLARTRSAVPTPSLVEAAGGKLGLADLPESDDGIQRTVTGVVHLGSGTYQGFASAVAANAGYATPISEAWWVDFTRSPVPTYPALDVLAGRVPASAFRNKVVLIGATFSGTGDLHPTPTDPLMSGVQLQAQAVATLAHGQRVIVVGGLGYPLFALVGSLLVIGLSWKARWSRAATAVLGGLLLYSIVCFGLANRNVFLPIVPVWLAGLGTLLLLFALRSAEEFLLRARVESTFGAFVSDRVRDVVLAHGGSVGTAPPVEMEATCLFLDIRDFVAIGSRLPPGELMKLLNRFFAGALAAVSAHEGLVSVFTGDGFLAVFGAPVSNPRHAECAWQAAQDILASLDTFNATQPGLPWRIGIGIHSGKLLSGYVGASGRFSYTVMGDAVNLSSRIQDSTKDVSQSVGISEETWAKLETPPQTFHWVQVPIKGKESTLSVYYV